MTNGYITCGAEGPCDLDPRAERLVPQEISAGGFLLKKLPRDLAWKELGDLLARVSPRALGVLLEQGSQLHWYAYREARVRSIPFVPAPVQNVPILTGFMREVPVEAVVATRQAADLFLADALTAGVAERIKGWLIVGDEGESAFAPSSGVVMLSGFPWT